MSRDMEATNYSQSHGRGRGRGHRGPNKHGGAHGTQRWDLPTDFNGEGSGFQQQGKKRRRHNTSGTVSQVFSEHTQSKSCETKQNDFDALTADDKLSLILTKLNTNETHMSTLQRKFDTAFGKGGQLSKLEETVRSQSDRLTALEYRSIDIEARSRRNNLLFKGFPEMQNENCASTVSNFIKTRLMISDELSIQRAHRLGKFSGDRVRFIIVAFTNYTDTENILAKAFKLKGSQFAISRDFPSEIVEARKTLWPQYRDLRSKYQNDRVYIAYPASLMHNGRVVREMFPDWINIMRQSRAKPDSRTDRYGSRDLQTRSKEPHASVYDCSTETSPGTSDSDDEEPMAPSSSGDQSNQASSEAEETQTVTSTPNAESSSQADTQPNDSSQPDPMEPVSPSIIRDGLSEQRDPDPPPVFNVPDTNS